MNEVKSATTEQAGGVRSSEWLPGREAAGTRALGTQTVGGIDQLASLERETAASDAGGQIIAETLELLDPGVELFTPRRSQLRPVGFAGGPPPWKAVEGLTDVGERDTNRLCSPDEREPAERVAPEPSLVALIPTREDESLSLVEVECGDRESTAFRDLADRPGPEQLLAGDHARTIVLDLNHC